MTIEQRVERMFNPGGSTPVGTGFPLVPFASLPAASTVEGQVRRLTELPHVSLIALGGIWRPFGGRQVLASRSINPVTVQNLAGAVAETIGPFPGGLVRAGMRLEIDATFEHTGIGTGARVAQALLNGGLWMGSGNLTQSLATTQEGRQAAVLRVISDTLANHRRGNQTQSSYLYGIQQYDNLSVDFSADWSADILLTSCAETAVAISTATWVGGVATYNTSAVHTLAVGDKTTIAGVSLAGYNGVVIVTSVPTTTQFTAVIADPGGSGTGGTSSRISNMISQSYVLELVG